MISLKSKYIIMKRTFTILFAAILAMTGFAQENKTTDSSWKKSPRYTPDRINNLVHTKLDVKFDYNNSYLIGKAWVTLTPHFNATNTLTLDAKGMEIKKLALVVANNAIKDLQYNYNKEQLTVQLDKVYKKGQKYTIYVDYVAKPDEYEKQSGRDPMLGIKGLFFINPKGEDKTKPIQIWTQGETESNSVWFPTIDQTQQKTTQEIFMTVPAKYVSLSNGKLVSQKQNGEILVGIDSMLASYTLVGKGFLVFPLRLKLLRPLLAHLYRKFARNRYRISRLLRYKSISQCDGKVCKRINPFFDR